MLKNTVLELGFMGIWAYDTYLCQLCLLYGLYGIICIKDTYVVGKYVKKTVLELGFRHLPVPAVPSSGRRPLP
jgi:hypothetical protein